MASFCTLFQTFMNQSKSLRERLATLPPPPHPQHLPFIIWQNDFLYVQFCGTGELLTVYAAVNRNSCMAL